MEISKESANRLPNILITGTPGVGKTSLSLLLENELLESHKLEGFKYIKLAEIVNQEKLYKEWNKEFDVPEFDVDMVCDYLEPFMSEENEKGHKGGIILEFHSCDFFPERWFDLVVLLRCDNTILYDRLAERKYNEKKIKENIECEIMDVTKDEVYDSYKEEIILELESNRIEDMESNME